MAVYWVYMMSFFRRICFKHLIQMLMLLAIIYMPLAHAWLVDKEGESVESTIPNKLKAMENAGDQMDGEQLRALIAAVEASEKKAQQMVAKYWSSLESSNEYQWVIYKQNFERKIAIDYLNNQIRITIPRLRVEHRTDFVRQAEVVQHELTNVLGLTLYEVLLLDQGIQLLGEEYKDQLLPEKSGSPLLFSELFTDSPSQDEIQMLANDMMANAYIRYHDQLSSNSVAAFNVKISSRITYEVPLPKERLIKKAKEYVPLAESFGKDLSVPPSLVMAIMHTESYFNPLAKSSIPAFGLMQIVPRTGGADAVRSLYDRPPKLSPGYLYDPKNNVELGTAYLSILYYRYLSKVKDPMSRMFIAVAAYNAGASNVAKAFVSTASMQHAVDKINSLSAQEVLDKLQYHAPAQQTRDYVKKVLKRKKRYDEEGIFL